MVNISIKPFIGLLSVLLIFTIACSAQQTEEQALQSLRQMTKDGKLPAESVVLNIENRFKGKRTGALAKLLRARIRFENKDFSGVALILDSDEFTRLTSVGDYALFFRGRVLRETGKHNDALAVFEKLRAEFPYSLHRRESLLLSGESMLATGRPADVETLLAEQIAARDPASLMLAARASRAQNKTEDAIRFFRLAYFHAAGTDAAAEAANALAELGQDTTPNTLEEFQTRAEKLYDAKKWSEAHAAYLELSDKYPSAITPQTRLRRVIVGVNHKNMPAAQAAFDSLPVSAAEREQGYLELAAGYATVRQWAQARRTLEEMQQKYPNSDLTPRAWVRTGMAARDAKNRVEEQFFLRRALASYPEAVEVAGAQFELAWLEHESGNVARSAEMLIEHLARYTDRDTTNRGRAGYWAARDSEKAGKLDAACELYDAVAYRYGANWYGHLGLQRLGALRQKGECQKPSNFPANSLVPRAAANLKVITVERETAGPAELKHAEKADQLTTVGLFDWAMNELNAAKRTADNSPSINLALAKHYRLKGSNINALLALAKSYPDYAQMFPEEMGREEWDVFYPLDHWEQIKKWADARRLDRYEVAGLIRQESVFEVRIKSHANAYGLMQLLLPTARQVARKYGSSAPVTSAESLYQPALNIELGTGYMREQLDKFGRIEFMAVAYNAGPGRVPQWRRTLPTEMDEFVEAIPFRETRGYVQGIIRNSAQYRRLYDENGRFKANVGTKLYR